MSRADYLVVDSGGFIKAAPLRELADSLVTLQEVVAEIRDKETRQRMKVRQHKHALRESSGNTEKTYICKIYISLGALIVTTHSVTVLTFPLISHHQVLPYELQFRNPTSHGLAKVRLHPLSYPGF